MNDKKDDKGGDNSGPGGGNGHGGPGSDKKTTIIVNTREKKVEGDAVKFDQVVRLAFENPPTGDNIEITVAFRKGPRENPSGTMHPGQSVKIKEGMIFDVTATDKS
jgi:hypothetical protein